MLGKNAGRQMYTNPDRYVIFDLETTGTSSNTDRIVEIGAVRVEEGRIAEQFSTLVDPEIPIPFYASTVNGITDDMVSGSPTMERVMPEFIRFIGDDVLVGHNIGSFDMKFICRDCELLWNLVPDNPYVDTLYLARNLLPQLKHHRLTDLAEYYGISVRGAHRALNDCVMNQKVYEKLRIEMKMPNAAVRVCPECGKFLKQRKGKFGTFWGCTGYPVCKHTEKV